MFGYSCSNWASGHLKPARNNHLVLTNFFVRPIEYEFCMLYEAGKLLNFLTEPMTLDKCCSDLQNGMQTLRNLCHFSQRAKFERGDRPRSTNRTVNFVASLIPELKRFGGYCKNKFYKMRFLFDCIWGVPSAGNAFLWNIRIGTLPQTRRKLPLDEFFYSLWLS